SLETAMSMTTDSIFELMAARGLGRYGLSDVTQLDHALQSAELAAKRGLGDALVIAALLHDLGHLVVGDDVNLAADGIDDLHEESAARVLAEVYGPSVSEPVRLHVAAKRYLCGTNPGYYGKLSQDSKDSLMLQGGPMTAGEIADFDRFEHRAAALQLRLIDDEAKVAGLATPGLETFRPIAARLEAAHRGGG
ncbi:MAG: HD domain-containing protein, partial [Hyphomicrobiaceae bacterium]